MIIIVWPHTTQKYNLEVVYLNNFRIKIFYFIYRLSQYISKPTTIHMQTTYMILRYINNFLALRLLFKHELNLTITQFTNSNWGAYTTTRRSSTSFNFYLGTSLISWRNKKQQVVSRSSSEVEYKALSNTFYELNGYYNSWRISTYLTLSL